MIVAKSSKRNPGEEQVKDQAGEPDSANEEKKTTSSAGEKSNRPKQGADDNADVKTKTAACDGGGDADKTQEAEEDPIADLEKKLETERDKYLRLAAEFDNYKKRSAKERETTYNDARVDVLTRMLPVYDNLERALCAECSDKAFYKGVDMTMTQLAQIMEGLGVAPIPALGEPFDPNRHNAVMTIENPELGEKVIAEEYQKGFMLGDRVIRFSTVVVAN